MYYQAIMWSLLLLVTTGCARQEILVPTPTAQDVPGTLYTAQAAHAGVSVSVSSNKWSSHPTTLEDYLTALHVAIVNDSGRPLRLRYNDFELVNLSGLAITALPPLRIEATIRTPVRVVPGFLYMRFWVAPFYAPYYSGISPWGAF